MKSTICHINLKKTLHITVDNNNNLSVMGFFS